eukprot:3977101-Amphidinium_carterae.1
MTTCDTFSSSVLKHMLLCQQLCGMQSTATILCRAKVMINRLNDNYPRRSFQDCMRSRQQKRYPRYNWELAGVKDLIVFGAYGLCGFSYFGASAGSQRFVVLELDTRVLWRPGLESCQLRRLLSQTIVHVVPCTTNEQ